MANDKPDYDVLVIGAGGAGLAAAICAAGAGARVALLEAGKRVGGSTALAGGFVYAAGTDAQRARGVIDGPDAMFDDIRAINGDSASAEVARRVCNEAGQTLHWLTQIGVDFPAERLSSPNGRMVARSHEPVGFGARIVECLDLELSKLGVDVACNTRVEQLVTDESGAVCGVRIGDDLIRAGAVVLTTGGFGANPELVQRMLPKAQRVGDWVWHVGNETNRGDGLTMAESVGAKIDGLDSALLLLTPHFHKDLEVIGADWVLMVNAEGRRFVNEDAAYWELSEALEAQTDPRGFCLFDRQQMLNAQPDPKVLEALTQGTISLSWIPRVLEEQIAKGRVLQSSSITGLAEQMGVDPAVLGASVERYNTLARNGSDADFGKAARCMTPIIDAPFYAVEVRPAILIVTGGGMCIDAAARVLRPNGESIPGLYAAGEAVGNVYGRYYVGSGYAIASALCCGRIAGREAAANAMASC